MNKDLKTCIKELKKEFPIMLDDCIFEFDSMGWVPLIHKTLEAISKFEKNDYITINEITIDNGSMDISFECSEENYKSIKSIIDDAKCKSEHTCQICGKKAYSISYGPYIFTLCQECIDKSEVFN